jgi:hypothetical protein
MLSDHLTRREILQNGSVRLSTDECSFHYVRIRPGVLLLKITGYDRGNLGLDVLDEIKKEITNFSSLRLFIDASEARGAASRASDDWTTWLRDNRASLGSVDIYVGSQIMYVIIAISKELSRTGNLIHLHTERRRFEEALRDAAPEYQGEPAPDSSS